MFNKLAVMKYFAFCSSWHLRNIKKYNILNVQSRIQIIKLTNDYHICGTGNRTRKCKQGAGGDCFGGKKGQGCFGGKKGQGGNMGCIMTSCRRNGREQQNNVPLQIENKT